jgi:hypothetical protein
LRWLHANRKAPGYISQHMLDCLKSPRQSFSRLSSRVKNKDFASNYI